MNSDPRTDTFLEAAAAGLAGDPEVQREVRAELAVHLEDAAQAARTAGLPADQAAAQALRAIGPAADIAADLLSANRRRLAWRARARLAVQALLVPAAVLLALATGLSPRRTLCLSPEQQLILRGDRTRPSGPARARAIWEAHPTNVVYLNNYLTEAMSDLRALGATPAAQRAALEPDLALAEAAEPGNARFRVLLAGRLLQESAEIRVVRPAESNRAEELSLVVSNAALFDRAMDAFRAAARKPYYRRYAQDMSRERLAMLGDAPTLREQGERIALAAGVLLPDLSDLRALARAACLEAEQAAAEQRPDDARALVEGCWKLAADMHRDAFTLVDVLVGNAIVGIYSNSAPALYERLGDAAAAGAASRKAALVSRPVTAWRSRVKAPGFNTLDPVLKRQGSRLAALLYPNLGQPISEADLRPGRLLEYTVAERVLLEGILLVLLTVMAVALLTVLNWRFRRGGASAPLLLLPDAQTTLRIALLGVVAPLAAFFAYTRWLPLGGRDLSAAYVWPKLALQAVTLAALVIGLTAFLAADAVRRRCRRLEIAAPPGRFRRPVRIVYAVLTGLAVLGCLLPSDWLAAGNAAVWAQGCRTLAVAVAGLLAVFLLAAGLGAGWRHWRGAPGLGLYYGTVARSLVPNLALAIILLSLTVRPYLAAAERLLVRADGATAALRSGGLPVESRLVQRLKAETLAALQDTDAGR